jgi:hypothetical protein
MIQDPSLSALENFKMFDRTSVVGVVSRNIIEGNYIFDMSLLFRWLRCAYAYKELNFSSYEDVEGTRKAAYEMLFSEGENSFYKKYAEDSFKDFFNGRTYTTEYGETQEQGYITNRDNRYKKKLKTDILKSYTSLFNAFISSSIIDFSFFIHSVEFIYIISEWCMDYIHNFDTDEHGLTDYYTQRYSRIDVFKKFVDDTKMFYKALTTYTENVINLT